MQETLAPSWVGKIPWRRDRLPTPVFLGFPCGSDGKDSACNVGDLGSIPGSGRFPGRGHGNPLQYSCLENPMDRGAWWATVHGSTESDTTEQLSISKRTVALQGISPTQGSNPVLLCCRRILYSLSHKGSPRILGRVTYSFSRGIPNPGIVPGPPAL